MREPCLAQAGNLNLSPTDRTAPESDRAPSTHPTQAIDASRMLPCPAKFSTLGTCDARRDSESGSKRHST